MKEENELEQKTQAEQPSAMEKRIKRHMNLCVGILSGVIVAATALLLLAFGIAGLI